jgi:superfamily II DNA or RNA helicase
MQKLLPLLTFVVLFFPQLVFSGSQCSKIFFDYSKIEFGQIKTQLETAIRNVSRNKKEILDQFDISLCPTGDCIELSSQTGIRFFVEVDRSQTSSTITISNRQKTLRVPSVDALADPANGNLIRRFLVGHELHPFSGTSHLRYKQSQIIALRAFIEFLKSGKKSFLHVAPTSMGKGINIALAYSAKLAMGEGNKLSILTADRLNIVDQLANSLRSSKLPTEVEIINWNEGALNTETFIQKLETSTKPIAIAITTQGLKALIKILNKKDYSILSAKLDGLFIDEAHHYGAPETFGILSELVDSSNGFLYGSTATPVHQRVNLRDFFDVEHWSYLNDRDNLFQEHSAEKGLTQLKIGIEMGEIRPFDELYIVGEPSFNGTEKIPLFINGESGKYVLNPEHYQRLAQIVFPILSGNPKGFIVAATIAEAVRISQFLGKIYPSIRFDPYHSKLSDQEKNDIFERSRNSSRHYIVAVRALDEGVNLNHLSAYIDLNTSVSVKQMIHRIGRVLRESKGNISSDILFLSDFRNESMAQDLLLVMDIVNKESFDSSTRKDASGDQDLVNPISQGLTRKELLEARKILEETARRFWASKQFTWMTFDEAQAHVRSLGIKSVADFYVWLRSDAKPINFPGAPDAMYKNQGWRGVSFFLGIKKDWMSFDAAEAFIRTQGLRSQLEFMAWAQSDKKPIDFPTNPQTAYKNSGWKSYADFLQTGRPTRGQWKTFEQAMSFARSLGLTSRRDYHKWVRESAERPLDLPNDPNVVYKKSGWISWQHFLGYDYISFEEAKAFVRELGFKTSTEFRTWASTEGRPMIFPSDPARQYQDEGWKGYGDFLGTGAVAKQNMVWMPYSEAESLMRSLKIDSYKKFKDWKAQGNRPSDFPKAPDNVYTGKGWKSWGVFFGTRAENFMSFEEARKLVHSLNFKTAAELKNWIRSDKRPLDFPKTPSQVYKENGWQGIEDFLHSK